MSSTPIPLRHRITKLLKHGDRPWNTLLVVMALLVLAVVVSIGWMLWQQSIPTRQEFGLEFVRPTLDSNWNPVSGKFDSWPFIYGTMITSLVALLIATPVSLGIGVFLAELSPTWLRNPISWMVELLAAIPSVVYGLWGIFVFLPLIITPIGTFLGETLGVIPGLDFFFKGPIPVSGASRLAAGFILAIMIIPTIATVSRDVFLAIPNSQREAALAMGATQWETIWQIQMGNHLADPVALRPFRYPGGCNSGTGARAGRNDGSHNGHRQ